MKIIVHLLGGITVTVPIRPDQREHIDKQLLEKVLGCGSTITINGVRFVALHISSWLFQDNDEIVLEL